MTQLIWVDDLRVLSCRVCGHRGDGDLILRVTALSLDDAEVIRCRACGSLDILDEPLPSTPDDTSIDGYLEGGVGLGTIATALGYVDPAGIRSMLDVGCNYGFALDLGRFAHGWDVVGIEPTRAGRRGAEELGLDIRDGYLTEQTELGRQFDLVFSSEVLEHVPEPLGFLRAIRAALGPGGRVILTTPAAEIIAPSSPESDVLSALSPGYHVFLLSAAALESLLQRAGFASVTVVRTGISLNAIAAVEPSVALESVPRYALPSSELDRYFAYRTHEAAPGSALAIGMAVRHLRSLVARGDFGEAVNVAPIVRSSLLERDGTDLDHPERALADWDDSLTPAWALMGAAFALGMIELLHTGDNERAARYFELTTRSAQSWRRHLGVSDLDSLDLLEQGQYHFALALARFSPAAAEPAALEYLATTGWSDRVLGRVARILVDIGAKVPLDPTGPLACTVAGFAPRLAAEGDGEARTAGLDALYVIGSAFAATGHPADARHLLELCLTLCTSQKTAHAGGLASLCVATLDGLVNAPTLPTPPSGGIRFMLDSYWCDPAGTFLEGWAHVEQEPVLEIALALGPQRIKPELFARPDVLTYWPTVPPDQSLGFRAYVPGPPHAAFTLELTTASGVHRETVYLPPHQLPDHDLRVSTRELSDLTRAEIAAAPPGPVLAIGLRTASEIPAEILELFGDRELVSLDIHDGPGVGVVGDAHQLSALFPTRGFAVVYSTSVLEHLTTPWLFAAECARVLVTGGIAVHAAPWIWPSHSQPNDFWRFSEYGLVRLFGEELGFRLRQVRSVDSATIIPAPAWRAHHVRMPTLPSGSMSWISVERTGASIPENLWPYDGEIGRLWAERYPLDGLGDPGPRP